MTALAYLRDSLRNFVSGLGTAKDKTTHNTFDVRPLTRIEIDAIYLEDGFARKIVDKVPADEVREWRTWEARQAETIYAAERQLKYRAKIQQARTWARLYGGAAILIGDGSTDPSQPLNIEAMGKGGIKYLHVLSRYELNPDEFERDIQSPNFGRPRTYTLAGVSADTMPVIHHSRLAIFDGVDAPRLVRDANQGWGLPLFQALRTAIMNAAASTANAAALTEEAKTDIIKMPDLTDRLSDEEGQRRLTARFTYANQAKSTINALLLGADETFERKQISFTGLPDVIRSHIEIMAGVADIPVTLLLGTAPKGMNATGDHDARNYYDLIKARQTGGLEDEIAPLDEALLRHALGTRPRSAAFAWVPLWQQTPAEKAATALVKAETTLIYAGLGIFPAAGFAHAVRDQIVEDGGYPSFDEHVAPETLDRLGDAPIQAAKAGAGAEPAAKPESAALADAAPRTLYVSRPVMNATAILAWAKAQGITGLVAAEDLHVTVVRSTAPVDWFAAYEAPETLRIAAGGARDIERFGGAGEDIVLLFRSDDLVWRHRDLMDLGASHDWPDYQPHITLAKNAGPLPETIEPYPGRIVLGPERFAEIRARPSALAA